MVPDEFCSVAFSGSPDGPITADYKNLTFTGTVTGGSSFAVNETDCALGPGSCMLFGTGNSDAPFTGVWSNGWHSKGHLSVVFDLGSGGGGTLQITTTNAIPEPSTFMMLGAGLLPVIGVIRRRHLNR